MYKVMLFAGTTEGRELTERFGNTEIQFHVYVATEYGGELVSDLPNVTVHTERLNQQQMEAVMEEGWDLILDATHPYAVEVSENIRKACETRELPFMRIVRERAVWMEPESPDEPGVVCAPDMQAAAEYLEQVEGRVLLTTGSKELDAFTKLKNYKKRLIVRVLPIEESIRKCLELGFQGKNLICMQGPFSAEMNREMLRQTQAAWLVTKESGGPGGFKEKLAGAEEAGAKVIVVGRPVAESGFSFEQAVEFLEAIAGEPEEPEEFHMEFQEPEQQEQQISLVGIGPGSQRFLCPEAEERIRQADLLIGAERMLRSVSGEGKRKYKAWNPDAIGEYLETHPEYTRIVILLSGDTGFYSGAKHLLHVLPGRPEVIPGISSLSYMAACMRRAWEQVRTVSLHGRRQNLISLLRYHRELFVLLDKGSQIQEICEELIYYGYGEITVCAGENLGMEEERLITGKPETLCGESFSDLSVLYLEQEGWLEPVVTHGLDDERFLRDKVPMTKQEVRTVSLAKLALKRGSVVYDIGAGTGSVAIEAALLAYEGSVWAIEQKEAAVQLLLRNKKQHKVSNMQVIYGTAPEAMKDLPVPDRIFIGGTSGRMKELLDDIYGKWADMHTVINAGTLETLTEITAWLAEHPGLRRDIVQISAARAKEAGSYHMMQGGTVIYVITIQGQK